MKETRSRRPSRNREKLLKATVQLMNEQGCNVGTAQIAEYCGISPGNLYYHFANREEILREIFGRLETDLDAVLHTDMGETLDAERLAGFYIGGARVLWHYRFVFSSATEFIFRDPWLANEYRDFTEHSLQQMVRIIQAVTAAYGNGVPVDAERIRCIAENKWIIWIAWPRFTELRAGAEGVREAEFARGLEQIFDLLAPYLKAQFRCQTALAVHRFVEDLSSGKT